MVSVCFEASEEIGFDKFDIKADGYANYLANLCVQVTQTRPESKDQQVAIKFQDLPSKAYFEECSLEFMDSNRFEFVSFLQITSIL